MTGLYAFTAEQAELRSTLRGLLQDHNTARACYDCSGDAPDRKLWHRLASLGITVVGIDEADGGSGGTVLDQLVVAEELGRAVAPVGFVPTVLSAAALGGAPARSDRARLLLAIADGTVLAGVILDDASLAYDCAGAEVLIVSHGDGLALIEGAAIEPLPSVDRTRPVAACAWPAHAAIPLTTSVSIGQLRELQHTLYAAEATGLAAAVLETTADYTRERRQFGLPIGTFQAVKHRLADMLVDVECARSAAYAAAWSIHDGADANLPAHMAQAVPTEAAVKVVSAAIQLHGGIGVTWEHDLHLYLRRAKALELATGTSAWHYDQIALALLGAAQQI